MSSSGQGGLMPPPVHPAHPSAPPSPARSTSNLPPPLPPRPGSSAISLNVDAGSGSESESDTEPEPESGTYASLSTPSLNTNLGAGPSSESLLSVKDEEGLSEVQLRELYDDEEIDRFLHLFSSYVREVRVAPVSPATSSPDVAQAAAASSAPALVQPVSPGPSSKPWQSQAAPDNPRTISEVIAQDFLVPLLPPPRHPPPEFTLNRLKQTGQRLYVAVEPLYSMVAIPLLKLATWQDTRRSFGYCALYWILWYHGLLLSALMARLLYELVSRKLHPYPSLAELREHRSRIDRSQTFGKILSTRLAATPGLGLRDIWDLFGDYKHVRKLKKARKASAGKNELNTEARTSLDDTASVHSVSFSTPDLLATEHASSDEKEEADLKRLGLFFLNEAVDALERVKNIFLWRQPGASAYYGIVFLGWFVLGLLPAWCLMRLVGLVAGGFFWHVVPVIAAIPESERSRIPSPLWIVPTDTEYAMDLISQRVARGLPVRPKRRRRGRASSDADVQQDDRERGSGSSSSVDWKKWGGRIASTKERAGDLKQMFEDGQWKQVDSWKALIDSPLSPKVVAPHRGPEPRIETQTFPAQLKANPGLVTLTHSTLFFTPLLASRPSLTVPLTDITGVKKTSLTKGIDVHYTETRPDGTREEKEANFMFVGSRSDLFARLVSWGGRRWARV